MNADDIGHYDVDDVTNTGDHTSPDAFPDIVDG